MGCVTPICAGDRRSLVTINREVRTPNSSGGYVTTWVLRVTAWVKIVSLKGYERFNQQELTSPVAFRFKGLFADLSAVEVTDQIITEDGMKFNIRDIDDEGMAHVNIWLDGTAQVVQ